MTNIPDGFREQYDQQLANLQANPRGFASVLEQFRYDGGPHPASHEDCQCAFAADQLARLRPTLVLDVGSYRQFVIGLLASYKVVSVDVRQRAAMPNEIAITCDAKSLDLPTGLFDAVVSLCTLEHLGLGRYGDEFDLDADRKSLREMVRVLRSGGCLIFTTTITRGEPSILFNAHRIYSHRKLLGVLGSEGLKPIQDSFIKRKGHFCPLEEVTGRTEDWDIYCGCWEKIP